MNEDAGEKNTVLPQGTGSKELTPNAAESALAETATVEGSENQFDPYRTEPVQTSNRASRYRFLRPLGEGNLGVLSVSLDTELKREIALKRIKQDLANNPAYVERFSREAEITGALEHPGIVPIYGFGKDDRGQMFYAMRLIRGEELTKKFQLFHARVLDGSEPLNGSALRSLLRRLVDICNTMAYAHSRGVVHRDLKPANLMVGPYGETLVVDWGMAKPKGSTVELTRTNSEIEYSGADGPVAITKSTVSETHDGSIIGTPLYAPPEQLLGKLASIDHRSDIYSLGIILYELLTGSPPLRNCTLSELTNAAIQGQIPRPREIAKAIPKSIEAVCLKAIRPKQEDRYQDVLELRRDLERFLDDQPVTAYNESLSERALRWMRAHGPLVRAAAVSLFLLALVSTVFAYNISLARDRQAKAKDEATQLLKIARETTDQLLKNARDRLEDIPDAADIQELLLKDAAEAYRRIAEVNTEDPELRLETATAMVGLAAIQKSLVKRPEAIESLIQAITTLSELQEKTRETESRLGLARANIELSRIYGDEERLKEATEAVQAAATASQGLTTTDSATLLLSGEIAIQQAVLKHDAGDDLRALELNEKAASILRQAIEIPSQSSSSDAEQAIADIRYTLSRALNNEALIGSTAGLRTPAEVTKLYRDALTQLEWVFERFPNRKLAGKESADTKNNLAEHLRDHDDLAGARKLYKDSFENLTLLAEKNPQQFEFRHSAILALLGLASTDEEHVLEYAERAYTDAAALVAIKTHNKRYRLTAANAAVFLAEQIGVNGLERAQKLCAEALRLTNGLADTDVLPSILERQEMLASNLDMSALDVTNPADLHLRLQKFIRASEGYQLAYSRYNAAAMISVACEALSAAGVVSKPELASYLDTAVDLLRTSLQAAGADASVINFEKAKVDKDFAFLRTQRPVVFNELEPKP